MRTIARPPDYVVIGHVTQDQTGDVYTVGGTAAYAARTALAMWLRVGVVTAAAAKLDLSVALAGASLQRVDSAATTIFDNRYTSAGRTQIVRAVAAPLTAAAVPPAWRDAGLVHLGPVAGECDPQLAWLFPTAFLGLTPQGWMRRWDEEGRVFPVPWQPSAALLRRADAVVLSDQDLAGDKSLVARLVDSGTVLAVTRASAGCTIYAEGRVVDLPAVPAVEVDPTGAGDVFAAAFFVRLWRGDDPATAGRFANCVAALAVTRRGLETPTAEEIVRCA